MTADLDYAFRTSREDLERAVSDYLAVSRGAHLYPDPAAHEAAEQRAWDRLMRLRRTAAAPRAAEEDPAPATAE